jgi:DNA-directed RNA polymerase specialized sigma24 family protein
VNESVGKKFDLDVTFDDKEPNLKDLSPAELQDAVNGLPDALRGVAQGLLVEKRTMSDVSQDLGIRQSELVTRLHRAKLILGEK